MLNGTDMFPTSKSYLKFEGLRFDQALTHIQEINRIAQH